LPRGHNQVGLREHEIRDAIQEMIMSDSLLHDEAEVSQLPAGQPVTTATPGRVRWRLFGLGVLGLCTAVLATGCTHKPPAAKEKAIEVTVTTPVISDALVDYSDYTGRLEPMLNVDVVPRVSGYLEKVYLEGTLESQQSRAASKRDPKVRIIKEGDLVEQGELLFVIDQRSYKAALAAAKAQVALQQANLKLAQITLARARSAATGGSVGAVTALEMDQNRSQEEQSQANLDLARANLDTAATNFDYTEVRAPIRGRISRRMKDERNVVVADQTVLANILSEDKLYAWFDVDERAYLELMKEGKQSSGSWFTGMQFPVMMRLANEDDFTRSGVVDYIDNRVNGNTGTIRMRGVFDNANGLLKAGLFVRIRLPISQRYRGLLIPEVALQSDQGKKYVYVVKTVTSHKEDGTEEKKDVVEYRPVEVGQAIQGMRVIKPAARGKEGKEGLVEGERVIIVGMQRVRSKSEVRAELKAPPPAPKSPLVELFNKVRPQTISTRATN
jgi:RND family efflux transporter MFP subunit